MSNEDPTKQSYRDELAAAVEARKNPPQSDEQDPCDPCPEVDESFTFCVGNYDVRYSAATGKLTRVKARDMQDGWYDSVRVEDGAIKEYKKDGKNITVLNADCCPEDGEKVDDEIRIMENVCNLTEDTQDGLLTKLEWVPCDDWATLKGCGSTKQPLGVTVDWAAVKDDFFGCGITTSRCGFEVQDGLLKNMPAQVITGFVNDSQGVLAMRIDEQCRLHVEIIGANSGKTPVYEREINCASDSLLAEGNVGDPCDDGNGTVNVDVTSGFTAQVFETGAGAFVIGSSDSQARFCNTPPAQFASLTDAQTWLDANESLICGCASTCVPN